jgi:hypothetical protein
MSDASYVIRTFPNTLEAELAQAALEANGIPSALMSDDAGGMMPWLHLLHPVRIVVREHDVADAVRILAGLDAGEQSAGEAGAE